MFKNVTIFCNTVEKVDQYINDLLFENLKKNRER